jgi:hydrogenase maturation protein HypF
MNAPLTVPPPAVLQRRLRASGVVQGVGFRPYVWRLAHELGLAGWVRNDAGGVEILLEGEAAAIEAFTRRLPVELPPLARLRELDWQDAAPGGRHAGFVIADSGGGPAATMIGHDTAVCPDCLAEMFDPRDRRWRHAFITCTHCGPRYTLTRGLPYDRARTSMAAFPLCPACAREYGDPADRRFHAEPTSCPVCGPRLWLEPAPFAAGAAAPADDPIAAALALLRAGAIVAIKGLGGFHLACDARDAAAVARLRARKDREEKPFAVMAANVASLDRWVALGAAERALLESPERPIVLVRKRPGADAALPGIAPGLAWLGVMLPYTPLHWLLFHEAAGRPAGTQWLDAAQDLVLVMTSANPGGEPLVMANAEARARLAGIADALLLHDRDIVVRCDDTVLRLAPSPAQGVAFIRRARGYTPRPIRLPHAGPPVLALGGHLKNTVCVTRGDEAYVSQHIGGLDNPATCAMLVEVTRHLLDILAVEPAAVAHDLHPDFFSTRHALELAAHRGVPAIAVQHHHAHIAAIAAEHGLDGPVLGLALDGVGLGPADAASGMAWGGELLRVEGADLRRLGHLRPLPLPGGERAAREPWRMAAAVLHALGRGEEIARRFPNQPQAGRMPELLSRPALCPLTTSMGRWFDAAAGLLGVREVMAYEGQAAMLLEGLAEQAGEVAPMRHGHVLHADGRLDLLPLLASLADEPDPCHGAARFHATLARALVDWVMRAAEQAGLDTVALGGGCFLNHVLTRRLTALLQGHGMRVLTAAAVPPNDGGLSLGQAWVTICSLRQAEGLAQTLDCHERIGYVSGHTGTCG